jgi:hypothetical protein
MLLTFVRRTWLPNGKTSGLERGRLQPIGRLAWRRMGAIPGFVEFSWQHQRSMSQDGCQSRTILCMEKKNGGQGSGEGWWSGASQEAASPFRFPGTETQDSAAIPAISGLGLRPDLLLSQANGSAGQFSDGAENPDSGGAWEGFPKDWPRQEFLAWL